MRPEPARLESTEHDALDEIEADDVADAPVSVPRLETPPPPPLPTRRDVNRPSSMPPAEPDLSDVFAAITPKKGKGVPLPPGVKERKKLLQTQPVSKRPEPVVIPPPPRVPAITGPVLPPPPAFTPATPPPVSVSQPMRPTYTSSLSPIALQVPPRSFAPRPSSMPAPGGASATPVGAIVAAAAVLLLVVSAGGFAVGFTRASGRAPVVPEKAARTFETARMTELATESASDKDAASEIDADGATAKAKPSSLAFGTIRFASPPAGARVDGAPRKVAGGMLVVTCGTHRVKWPGHAVQAVSVPCNGSTTL